ncbi:MAG: MEDS domain-containing protein [Candidatus Bathyarchaeota archaeon]|nr:MEDS domain-containing protein [Candidatus Bathyarchaeota archaeon]
MSLTPHALSIQNHHCCLYARKEEQLQIVKPFIKDSFIRHENARAYIYAPRCNLSGIEYLQQLDPDFVQFHQQGHLELVSASEIFLEKGQFNIDHMLNSLSTETVKALSQRYAGLRVTSEMAGCLRSNSNLDPLIRYEVELNRSLPRQCTMLCQYDQRVFTRSQLIDLIPLHSQIITDIQITFNFISEISSELLEPCISKSADLS